jgi:hypothetical protein
LRREKFVLAVRRKRKKLQNLKEGWEFLFFLWLRNNLRGRQWETVVLAKKEYT